MCRAISVQVEVLQSCIEHPVHLDHSWQLYSSLVHAHLFSITGRDEYVSEIVDEVDMVENNAMLLRLTNRPIWSDGSRITTREVAEALRRGERHCGARIFDEIRHIAPRDLLLSSHTLSITKELLSSPIFAITSRRGAISNSPQDKPVFCGPYILAGRGEEGIVVARNNNYFHSVGPEKIHLKSVTLTAIRDQLESGELTVSASLGMTGQLLHELKDSNFAANRRVKLALVLRCGDASKNHNSRQLSVYLSSRLDRNRIANATELTYVPASSLKALFSSQADATQRDSRIDNIDTRDIDTDPPALEKRKIVIFYVDFFPNKLVALECAEQISNLLSSEAVVRELSYASYLQGLPPELKNLHFLLEIIQPILPERFYFGSTPNLIVLGQAVSTAITLDERLRGKQIINNMAILDWRSLSI